MFSEYYKKLLLPSNGLNYSEIISIRPLETSFIFNLNDLFYNSSQSELITSILENHIKFNLDISELFFSDAFFIWIYLFHSATNSGTIEHLLSCSECQKENKVSIEIQNLDIIYRKKESSKFGTFKYKDYSIDYEFRKIKHNLYTSNISASTTSKIETLKHFIYPQIIEIKKGLNSFPRDKLDSLIQFEGIQFLMDFLKAIKKEPFGIQNNLNFKCHSCGILNELTIVDSLNYSMILLNEEITLELTERAIESILAISDSKYLTASEALKIPYSNLTLIQNKITQAIKKKSGGKDYLSEFSNQ